VAWPTVELGQVISLNIDTVEVDPTTTYDMAGVYSFGRGLFTRGPLSGAETTYKRFHRLSTGMIVLSQLKAWEGAVGVVDGKHDGMYLSTQFPTFTCDASQVLEQYVGWYLRHQAVWGRLRRLARGMGARRDTVSPESFLSVPIPLPPLDHQSLIATKLDRVVGLVKAARETKRLARSDVQALVWALIHGDPKLPYDQVPFGELVSLRPRDVEVVPDEEYQFAGVYSFGKGVFKSVKKLGSEFSYTELTRLNVNDFTYPKLMAWEGALGVVPPECAGCVVSPEFPVFEINTDLVEPEVLDAYFRSVKSWRRLGGPSRGTNVRRRRLNPKTLCELMVPLPPKALQARIKEIMHKCVPFGQDDEGDLDAVLPAMLHEVFGDADAMTSSQPVTESHTTTTAHVAVG
tara:strand:+ start:1062 stop:2270 length:1209 start_codon:yes stop_codon:yes gene_type:complete